MDRAVANALARKSELERELTDINTFIALYNRFGGDLNSSSEAQTEPAEQAAGAVPPVRVRTRAYGGKGTPPPIIADAAVKAVQSAGRPLEKAELVEAVEAGGAMIASGDKPAYMNIILLRYANNRLMRVGSAWGTPEMAQAFLHKALAPKGTPSEASDDQDDGGSETESSGFFHET